MMSQQKLAMRDTVCTLIATEKDNNKNLNVAVTYMEDGELQRAKLFVPFGASNDMALNPAYKIGMDLYFRRISPGTRCVVNGVVTFKAFHNDKGPGVSSKVCVKTIDLLDENSDNVDPEFDQIPIKEYNNNNQNQNSANLNMGKASYQKSFDNQCFVFMRLVSLSPNVHTLLHSVEGPC